MGTSTDGRKRVRRSAASIAVAITAALALTACTPHSEAYGLGHDAGALSAAQVASLGEWQTVARSWGMESSDSDLRAELDQHATEWCEVAWLGQGVTLSVQNTPENRADFMRGCLDGIRG